MTNFFLAQDGIQNKVLPDLYNTGGTDTLSKVVRSTIGVVFVIAAVSFMFLVAWGAVQWIMSGGDKAAVQSAQSKITNAIIGLVILFATYAILNIVGYFFGVSALQLFSLDLGLIKIQ